MGGEPARLGPLGTWVNGVDPSNLVAAAAYLAGAVGAAFFGDASIVVDALAAGGFGAIAAQLVILRRSAQGIRGREAEIVAAWTAACVTATLMGHGLAELL